MESLEMRFSKISDKKLSGGDLLSKGKAVCSFKMSRKHWQMPPMTNEDLPPKVHLMQIRWAK